MTSKKQSANRDSLEQILNEYIKFPLESYCFTNIMPSNALLWKLMRKNFYELNYWKNHHINLGTSPRINLRIIQTFTSISPRIRKEFRFIRDWYQLFRAQPSTHLTETFRGCRNAHKTAEKQINGWICHHTTKSRTNIDYILIRQYCQVPLFSVFSRKHSIAISWKMVEFLVHRKASHLSGKDRISVRQMRCRSKRLLLLSENQKLAANII